MNNVFAQSSRLVRSSLRGGARRLPVRSAFIVSSALILPGTAWADCTPVGAASGSTVTCTSNSPSYTNLNTGLTVNADATAVVVAPLVIGNNSSLTIASGGNIQGSTAAASVQFGDNAMITNNGTITSSSATSGGAAIQVGVNSTVTNNGTLTAAAGTPAVLFGADVTSNGGGTFNNSATATAEVVGNVVFGENKGASVATFNNYYNTATLTNTATTYGLAGNVTGTGNMAIYTNGQWTGALVQTADGGSVSIVNDFNNSSVPAATTTGIFTGVISTGDATTLTNNGTMLLNVGSGIGTFGAYSSAVTNNGTLTIGSTVAPALLKITGSFTQGTNGVLNLAIAGVGTPAINTVSPYSQIYAASTLASLAGPGTVGTASLAGTLNVNVVAGFYPANTVFKLIVADAGITGNFSSVNVLNASSTALPFLSFTNLGVQPVSGTQQAFELEVERVGTYATDIVTGGAGPAPTTPPTPNQLAVATALQPLTVVANTTPTGQEATLVGQIDQLTVAQATALFDQLSPAGLLSYANALRDEANNFERAIQLRMQDQNSDHAEDGWWGSANGQVDVSKATTDSAKQKMFGFNLGYDLSGPHHVFGVAGTVTFDSLHNLDSTLKGHNRDFAIAGYGGYDAGPIHLTGQVAYNFGHLSTTRTLTLGTVTDTATGKASEHLFKATGTAGFMLHLSDYTFEPFGGIDFMRGKIKGFTETGDGAAALTVLPINADRTDLLAGLAITRSSGKLRPYVRATYRSQIGHDGATTVSAYFDGNTATTFTVDGVPAARHEEDINAGLNWVFEDAGSLFVGYQGTLRSGFNSHGINLGIRLEF